MVKLTDEVVAQIVGMVEHQPGGITLAKTKERLMNSEGEAVIVSPEWNTLTDSGEHLHLCGRVVIQSVYKNGRGEEPDLDN